MPLKLNINDIIALYKDGVSVKKISERYNCSDTTIRNKLRQNGVKLKNKRITKEKSQQIATMYNSGADVKDLAKLFGLNPVTIRKHIKKHGIELRNNMIILSENQLREIKNLLATNVSLSEIGRRYNLSPSSIGKVLERYGVYKIKPNKNIIDMRKYGNDIFNLRIIRKKDVRNFFQYIYYDARQFKLKRKYNIFLEHM